MVNSGVTARISAPDRQSCRFPRASSRRAAVAKLFIGSHSPRAVAQKADGPGTSYRNINTRSCGERARKIRAARRRSRRGDCAGFIPPARLAFIATAWTLGPRRCRRALVDCALAGDGGTRANAALSICHRESAMHRSVIAAVAMMLGAVVDDVEPGRGECLGQQGVHFGGNRCGHGERPFLVARDVGQAARFAKPPRRATIPAPMRSLHQPAAFSPCDPGINRHCDGMTTPRLHGRYATNARRCDSPACRELGEFRAPPRGFDGPGDYRWFCLDHVPRVQRWLRLVRRDERRDDRRAVTDARLGPKPARFAPMQGWTACRAGPTLPIRLMPSPHGRGIRIR